MISINNAGLLYNFQQFSEIVQGTEFPWYFQLADNNVMQFAHCLMKRNVNNIPVRGDVNSDYFPFVEHYFTSICRDNNIKINNILRASVNCTLYNEKPDIGIHKDHQFEHNIFLLYMNDVSKGDTVFYDNDDEIRVSPKKNTAIVFSGNEHTHEFCLPSERRIVLVITFN